MIIIIFFALTLVLAAAPLLGRTKAFCAAVPLVYSALHAGLTLFIFFKGAAVEGYFGADSYSKAFLAILSVVFGAVALYNFDFVNNSKASVPKLAGYCAALVIFAGAMTAVLLSVSIGLMWVFIEATTLASAYLILFNGGRHSLEAAWKYIFICSIGIAFAFAGIIFLSASQAGGEKTLVVSEIINRAGSLDKLWLKISFVLMTVGFGTKAGLAPVHAWLPDAHSEAPSPVSALLSAALLNTAMLAIIRVFGIMEPAGLGKFASGYLMLMGLLSVFVASVYIIRTGNYKRMLAYSSVENMGIIAAAVSLGKPAFIAVLIHAAGHSLAKASLFLTSGTILKRWAVKEISGVTGVLKADPKAGWLWALSFLMIAAVPPSPLFFSELKIVSAMLSNGMYIQAAALIIMLTVIIYGMANAVFKMAFGSPAAGVSDAKLGILRYAPQVACLITLMAAGILIMAKGI